MHLYLASTCCRKDAKAFNSHWKHTVFEMPTQIIFIISKLGAKSITYIIYFSHKIKSIWSLHFFERKNATCEKKYFLDL